MTTMGCLFGSSLLMITVNLLAVSALISSDVCYGYLGCFSMASPWFSALRPLPPPQSPEAIDTQFYLYTRSQPIAYKVTKLPTISLAGSDYVGSKPTFILVQGFLGSHTQMWIQAMKNAFLKEFDGNVVIVDWTMGSTQLNYLQVAANARVVGAEVTRFAKFLLSDMGAAVSRFHLVGHSIGAHISGYVGKAIPGIARITVLVRWVFCHHARAFYVYTAAVANKGCTFWGHRSELLGMSLSILSKGYLTQFLNLGECTGDTCSPLGLQTSVYPARGVFLVKTTGTDPFCIADNHNDDVMAKYKTMPTALV